MQKGQERGTGDHEWPTGLVTGNSGYFLVCLTLRHSLCAHPAWAPASQPVQPVPRGPASALASRPIHTHTGKG